MMMLWSLAGAADAGFLESVCTLKDLPTEDVPLEEAAAQRLSVLQAVAPDDGYTALGSAFDDIARRVDEGTTALGSIERVS